MCVCICWIIVSAYLQWQIMYILNSVLCQVSSTQIVTQFFSLTQENMKDECNIIMKISLDSIHLLWKQIVWNTDALIILSNILLYIHTTYNALHYVVITTLENFYSKFQMKDAIINAKEFHRERYKSLSRLCSLCGTDEIEIKAWISFLSLL